MREFLKKRLKNERGLTLVELLAVIVILGIVAIIAFVMIGNIIENSRKDAHIANAQQLIDAAKLYEANGYEIEESVGSDDLKAKDILENLIDPWEKSEYEGTVTKNEDGEYYVNLKGKNCDISDKSELDLAQDERDNICD